MNRKLKVFGLMMAALFAVSAVSAQAAFAEEEFHAHAEDVVLTGAEHPQKPGQVTRIYVNGVEKGNVTCNNLEVWGTVKGTPNGANLYTSPEATVHPKYTECTSSFGSASVNTEECHYNFTAKTVGEHAEVHVICPAGQSIKVTVGGVCTLAIGEQTVPGIKYTNVNTTGKTENDEITLHATTGKTIDYTSSGFGCSLGGIPSKGTEGEYEGTATVEAKKWVSGTTTAPNNSYVDGEQVGIFKE